MRRLWWRLIRFGFRLLYNELAFTYDFVSKVVSLGAWRCWQRSAIKHLKIQPGALILELAHGTGDLQLDLHAAGYRPVGYDLSPYMGRIAQSKLRRHHLTAKLGRGLAQQLPFAMGAFSAVVSTFPTDFILAPETLREVNRVLQPGGTFIIVPNGAFTGGGAAKVFLEWLYRVTGQQEAEKYTRWDAAVFFNNYGFEAKMVQEPCPRSIAQVIVAHKRA
jgi:ubiquinone/menaquinone biosynthesis C-methylase UbiE